MIRYIRKIALFARLFLMFIILSCLVSANDTMSVEVNLIASNTSGNSSVISVEVPDSLFFGNVSNGGKSEEFKVYINNTGNVDINVKPQLVNSSEKVFDNLYFRKFKTSNGTNVPFTHIGDFNLNISKPVSGSSYSDEYFYVILDLSSYFGTNSNLMGHKTNVKFIATQR